MTKSIHTLIPDMKRIVTEKGWFNEELARGFSTSLVTCLESRYKADEVEGDPNKKKRSGLRLSQMGARCPRALWFSVHYPELAEALPPWAEVKFTFGDIIEAYAILIAKAAGHTVEGEQDELRLDGIVGHRDCVIDGCVVDVKSSSSRAFQKYKDRELELDDSFGYLDQLDGYVVASADDPIVKVKDKGYILAIDKQLGHMITYEHTVRAESIKERIKSYKSIVSLSSPPACGCGTRPEGKSGNIKLDVKASYSPFKYYCFPDLRTFIYSSGPVYLTHVARKPDVHEVQRDRNPIQDFRRDRTDGEGSS